MRGPGFDLPGDGSTTDTVDGLAVDDYRDVGLVHEVVDAVLAVLADVEGGAGDQVEHERQAGDQDVAVCAGVRDVGVLNEGAVPVETIARLHVLPGRGQAVQRAAEPFLVPDRDRGARHGAAEIKSVGTGGCLAGGSLVDLLLGRIRDEVVDSRGGLGEDVRGQLVAQKTHDVADGAGCTGLPVPPVAVLELVGVVPQRQEAVESGDRGGQNLIASEVLRAGDGPAVGQGEDASGGGGDVRGLLGGQVLALEYRGRSLWTGCEIVQRPVDGAVQRGEEGRERWIIGIEEVPGGDDVDPALAKFIEERLRDLGCGGLPEDTPHRGDNSRRGGRLQECSSAQIHGCSLFASCVVARCCSPVARHTWTDSRGCTGYRMVETGGRGPCFRQDRL